MAGSRPRVLNALTVDLEDWAQGAVAPHLPVTPRVLGNTERVLRLLESRGVRATFFALGKVCEKFPSLLPMVAKAGHEIGTHGYGHELLFGITPEQFRQDVARSLDIIETQTGRRPVSYRAPAFSITRDTLWAGPILADLGIRYSSSIFPIAGRRYGIPNATRFPHRWPTCDLLEFPLTTIRRLGRNWPVCGGGYIRLLPHALIAGAIREVNGLGHPAVLYLHPYELNVHEVVEMKRQGWPISWKAYFHQSLFRGRVRGRLLRLLEEFPFAPLAEVLDG